MAFELLTTVVTTICERVNSAFVIFLIYHLVSSTLTMVVGVLAIRPTICNLQFCIDNILYPATKWSDSISDKVATSAAYFFHLAHARN